MKKKTIEVELRGPLNNESYFTLLNLLKSKGSFVSKQNRFLLDYSTFLEGIGERKLDVRIRVTNGKVEIIIKKGKFGGTSREEVSIFPEGGNFDSSLKLMSLLGYNKAVACNRGIERYLFDGVEFAIQDVNDFNKEGIVHSRFFEAEIMCSDENEKNIAVEKVQKLLSSINLNEFSEQEWNEYVKVMNNEANGVFDYENDNVERIINLGK
jgi:adenylate cyclase class IV